MPLTVRLSARSREEFIQNYFPDVMQGGIFIRTEGVHNLELGSPVQLRFLLEDGTAVLAGRGIVAWLQRQGADRGIGVQFRRLSPASHVTYRQMLRLKRAIRSMPRQEHQDDSAVIALGEFSELPTRPMSVTARSKLVEHSRGRAIRRTPPPLPAPKVDDESGQYMVVNRKRSSRGDDTRPMGAGDIPLPEPERHRRRRITGR